MPYYVHTKNAEVNPETDSAFYERATAASYCDSATQKITYQATSQELADWRERENARFSDGTYTRVPWAGKITTPANCYDHYAHLSIKQPGLIAYTKDRESGYLDRQTPMRAGAYLTRFYSDYLSATEIAAWAETVTAITGSGFKIATTADDIQAVYENGPNSCMAHTYGASRNNCKNCQRNNPTCHYTYLDAGIHPVRVYGDSDLAVAYIGTLDHVIARAVIWPDKKRYSTVYGAERLTTMLENAGYSDGTMYGAKVRAIPAERGEYVMPYVDGISSADTTRHNGQTWIVLGSGHLQTSETTGISGELEENHDTNEFYCDGCEEYCSDDNYGGTDPRGRNSYCSDCYSRRYRDCDSCHETCDTDDLTNVGNGDDLCSDCYAQSEIDCAVCGDTFNPADWSNSESRSRERDCTDTICDDCEKTHVFCTACDEFKTIRESVKPADDLMPILFDGVDARSGDRFQLDGIRSYAYAVDSINPYACQCSECGHPVRPEDNGVLDFDSVPTGTDDQTATPNVATTPDDSVIQIPYVYRNTGYGSFGALYYDPQYSAIFNWPYSVARANPLNVIPDLAGAERAFVRLASTDAVSIVRYRAMLRGFENLCDAANEVRASMGNTGTWEALPETVPSPYADSL